MSDIGWTDVTAVTALTGAMLDQMGYKGVKTALMAIKKQPIPEKLVDSGLKVVTKANLETPEIQKLLHPH